jgi:hypothetical protein
MIDKDSVMITRQQPSFFLERHFFSVSDLCLFSFSCLFTEVSQEERLFVEVLMYSVAVEDTSAAIFVRHWRCANTVDCWTEILVGFLCLYKTFLSFGWLHKLTL